MVHLPCRVTLWSSFVLLMCDQKCKKMNKAVIDREGFYWMKSADDECSKQQRATVWIGNSWENQVQKSPREKKLRTE